MNREFQSETVMIHLAYSNICAFYRTILGNFIKRDYIKSKSDPFDINFQDPNNFLPESEWNLGSKVETLMNDQNIQKRIESDFSTFRVCCLNTLNYQDKLVRDSN